MADGTAEKVRASDLVTEGGVAGNAEAMIDAVYGARPPELLKAIHLPHHARVHAARRLENPQYDVPETPKLDFADVAKAAGISGDDTHVVAAALHGSDLDSAWVVYVAEDSVGSHFKGAYPYCDHGGRGKSKQHTSEAEAFAESAAGKTLAKAREAQEGEVKTTRRTRKTPAPPEAGAESEDDDEAGAESESEGDGEGEPAAE